MQVQEGQIDEKQVFISNIFINGAQAVLTAFRQNMCCSLASIYARTHTRTHT